MEKIWNIIKYPVETGSVKLLGWYEEKVWNPMVRHYRITISVLLGMTAVLFILDKV